ncbi:MAG TPA: hydroxyisourate hydrolase [Casimicrobiaceae bacterium]|nr:hydroxyisourate hydrolase [Casimicrobiaceae bacterium]
MPGISIHVVDVTRGVAASGMRVEVFSIGEARSRIVSGEVSPSGIVDDAALSARFAPGAYDVLLHVGAFYARAGFALPVVPFLDVAMFRFGIADAEQHYHLPFKLTPWGYSCFRGGA